MLPQSKNINLTKQRKLIVRISHRPRNGMNSRDLSALLASVNDSATSSGMGTLGSAAGNGQSVLESLLIRKQAEEQQKALLALQLSSLRGIPSLTVPLSAPPDALSLLIQQKQLQALQSLAPSAGSLSRFSPASSAVPIERGTTGPSSTQLQALNSLLSSQQLPVGAPVAVVPSTTPIGSVALPADRKRRGRTATFPQKLHQILSDLEQQEGGTEIASFLPHGRAFSIHKPRDFVKHVMPNYFRMSRFASFQRQLNLYDFQRVTEGPDKGAYFHELFIKNRPTLATMMKRNKIKGVKNNADETSHDYGDKAEDAEDSASGLAD